MYPSIKTIQKIEWLDKIGNSLDIAKQVRGILDGSIDPDTLPNINSAMYNSRLNSVDKKLYAIDTILKTCGIEYFLAGKAGGYSYCNTCDSYALTIMYSYKKRKFLVSSWGDIAERNSR